MTNDPPIPLTKIIELPDEEGPSEYKLVFTVGVQQFDIGYRSEDRRDVEFMEKMFLKALVALRPTPESLLDPDMPAQMIRLHMGEMTAQEMRTARAAIRWANTAVGVPPSHPEDERNGLSAPSDTSLVEKLEAEKYPNGGGALGATRMAAFDRAIAIVRQHEAAHGNAIQVLSNIAAYPDANTISDAHYIARNAARNFLAAMGNVSARQHVSPPYPNQWWVCTTCECQFDSKRHALACDHAKPKCRIWNVDESAVAAKGVRPSGAGDEPDTLIMACHEVLRLMEKWSKHYAYSDTCEQAVAALRDEMQRHLRTVRPVSISLAGFTRDMLDNMNRHDLDEDEAVKVTLDKHEVKYVG